MLVLTRKIGSVLLIGDNIRIELLSITLMPQKRQNRADLAITIDDYTSVETVFEGMPFTLMKGIHLQVFSFDGQQLRMGITAPREVNIVRAEIARSQPRDITT